MTEVVLLLVLTKGRLKAKPSLSLEKICADGEWSFKVLRGHYSQCSSSNQWDRNGLWLALLSSACFVMLIHCLNRTRRGIVE